MGEKPYGMQIDRVDNEGNYEHSNCRWTTSKENSRNRRNNHLITLNDITKCVAKWVEDTGISKNAILGRLKRGWSEEEALTTKMGEKRKKKEFVNG